MTDQTIKQQSHAALLCVLAFIGGLMVATGAATNMATFLWNLMKSFIMWFIT